MSKLNKIQVGDVVKITNTTYKLLKCYIGEVGIVNEINDADKDEIWYVVTIIKNKEKIEVFDLEVTKIADNNGFLIDLINI